MTVLELIRALELCDPEAEVTICDPEALNGFREVAEVENFPFDDGVVIHLVDE